MKYDPERPSWIKHLWNLRFFILCLILLELPHSSYKGISLLMCQRIALLDDTALCCGNIWVSWPSLHQQNSLIKINVEAVFFWLHTKVSLTSVRPSYYGRHYVRSWLQSVHIDLAVLFCTLCEPVKGAVLTLLLEQLVNNNSLNLVRQWGKLYMEMLMYLDVCCTNTILKPKGIVWEIQSYRKRLIPFWYPSGKWS